MTINFEHVDLENNEAKNRFEIKVYGFLALVEYKKVGNTLHLLHTEVEEGLTGKGAGKAIIEKVLQYAQQESYLIKPFCPMIIGYIKKNEQWQHLVEEDPEN